MSGLSFSMVWSTGSPAGTMIQIGARGLGEVLHHVLERVRAHGTGVGEPLDGLLRKVKANHLMAGPAEALRHVSAHLAETDHSEFHVRFLWTSLTLLSLNERWLRPGECPAVFGWKGTPRPFRTRCTGQDYLVSAYADVVRVFSLSG